jgi:hypothetical protein
MQAVMSKIDLLAVYVQKDGYPFEQVLIRYDDMNKHNTSLRYNDNHHIIVYNHHSCAVTILSYCDNRHIATIVVIVQR